MCGRYVPAHEAAIEREWQVRKGVPEFPRRWNVAPGAIVPLLRLDPGSGELEAVPARWGLIPHWWKDAKPPHRTFNARVEEAASKPMWRDAMRRSRCLVPADGWYEWRKGEMPAAEARRAGALKQPYYIRREDGAPVAFAGLAAAWRPAPGADWVLSCAILTLPAAGGLTELHERMPVALPRDAQAAWLSPDVKDGAAAAELARSAVTVDALEHYPVSTRVNSALSEGPELIRREENCGIGDRGYGIRDRG
jgi:putative SOS response-associated peptidase YedK